MVCLNIMKLTWKCALTLMDFALSHHFDPQNNKIQNLHKLLFIKGNKTVIYSIP